VATSKENSLLASLAAMEKAVKEAAQEKARMKAHLESKWQLWDDRVKELEVCAFPIN
jgi:hypothetical protein